MDRNFLYSMVALLALANATIYIHKTNPSFFADLILNSQKTNSWIKEDPGWTNQNFQKSDNPPVPPKTEPVPPKTEPVPPKTEPVPPKTEPVPPKTEPVPPKTEPVPPRIQPRRLFFRR